MCPSSYCNKHREGLLFISKLDGKLCCSEHDPCGPEPLEPGEIREYKPETSGLGMAIIQSAASNSTAASAMSKTSRGREISAGAGPCAPESLPAFSITIPVGAPAAPPPPGSSNTPISPRAYDLPHYSPISSYDEEEDELLAEVEEEEEEEFVDEDQQKSDEDDEEAVYLEEEEDEDDEEEEEE